MVYKMVYIYIYVCNIYIIYIYTYGIQNKKETSFNISTTVFFKKLPCHI